MVDVMVSFSLEGVDWTQEPCLLSEMERSLQPFATVTEPQAFVGEIQKKKTNGYHVGDV